MMTKRANVLSHWVAHEVCCIKAPKQRRLALRKMIEVAKLCLEWNNFHTSMVITMGLSSRPIRKLDETWQSLSNRDMDTYHALQRNLDVGSNMGTYRQAFHKAKAPAIPFLPLVLKDLTFFMDGNQTYLPLTKDDAPSLINFAKFRSLTQPMDNAPLDRVAAIVEQRIRATFECYHDIHCESRLVARVWPQAIAND
ncbi:Rap guanine nucleotide exchange factor 3 [Apophysomyces sp. BC1034]|nr:Rap guanine nucleotide exchange factor 3 [Apophysomyces sp. BC1021]KAG0192864.1 Rap guanine nucleotide exchange factor 3 [Apophysomyces sp. BC1034]